MTDAVRDSGRGGTAGEAADDVDVGVAADAVDVGAAFFWLLLLANRGLDKKLQDIIFTCPTLTLPRFRRRRHGEYVIEERTLKGLLAASIRDKTQSVGNEGRGESVGRAQ